jgi:hypothetical protein
MRITDKIQNRMLSGTPGDRRVVHNRQGSDPEAAGSRDAA